jgi:hypothetical protein
MHGQPGPPAVIAVQLVLPLLQVVEGADVVQAELRAPDEHVQRRQGRELRSTAREFKHKSGIKGVSS